MNPYESSVQHRSRALLLLAVAFAALSIGSIAAVALISAGDRIPSPFAPASGAVGFFVNNRAAIRVGSFFELGAAIVLGIFSAMATTRLRVLGVRSAAVQVAFFGGVAASVFAALAAVSDWVLGQDGLGSTIDVFHALHLWSFALGGVAQVAGLGLFVVGVSLAGRIAGCLPRWVFSFGVVLAAMAELSTLGLVLAPALRLVGVAKLGVYAWMIAIGVVLSRESTHSARRAGAAAPVGPFRSVPQT